MVGAYGIYGWIKVRPYSLDVGSAPVSLLDAPQWWVQNREEIQAFEVETARVHSDTVVAKLVGVDKREDAEALKGRPIWIARGHFPAPKQDEYYWVDLLGCDVFGGEGEVLGRVVKVDDNGAHAILYVEHADSGKAHVIPFVSAYVKEVDLQSKRILTEWLESYSE